MCHNLLLLKCFGGLPGCTTTNSLLYLTHDIKNVQRQKKVVTIILLDIASAFSNAVTSRLVLNMKWLGYPTPLINFFKAMLEDCHMTLVFDGLTSRVIDIDNGIGQGDPSSMILYLIYSHALMAIPSQAHGDGRAYINDNFFTAQGKDFAKCNLKLNQMLDTQEMWSVAHNSHVELSKFNCLHLTCHTDIVHPDFRCHCLDTVSKSVNSTRLLGVKIDQELHWRHHVQHTIKKGMGLLTAINRLTWPSFGLPAPYVFRLFMAVAIPKVKYTLLVWYTPIHTTASSECHSGSVQHTRELDKLQ